jgi:hypothetical protein
MTYGLLEECFQQASVLDDVNMLDVRTTNWRGRGEFDHPIRENGCNNRHARNVYLVRFFASDD